MSEPRRRFDDPEILMAHGAGGLASRHLVEDLLLPIFQNPALDALGDAATLSVEGGRLAMSADGFVVRPLTFPGASIGKLAINGTVNDLAVAGATPIALLSTLVLEAGLPRPILHAELEAMALAARAAGVPVVGGDTKVVEHGNADGMYITTFGLGRVDPRLDLRARRVQPGDRVLLSGPIGDHGITVLLARGDVELDAKIQSDSRPLHALVRALIEVDPGGLRWMRDATRGGVASALNELALDTGLGVVLFEDRIPVHDPVRGACEILGLDPLHIANEGQFVAVVPPDAAEAALDGMRAAPGGERAALVGEVREAPARRLVCEAAHGGARVVAMLTEDPLPRIC